MLRERERVLEGMLRSRRGTPLNQLKVLDAGCGWGHLMAWLVGLGVPGANLTGVDVMPNRLASARLAYPDFEFIESDLAVLDLASESFDLVVCSTLFSSITDAAAAAAVSANLRRLLRPGGAVAWYDIRYPNPWNSAVRPLGRAAIGRLFPDLAPRLRSLTLLPQLSRRLGPAIGAYPLLAAIPPLRTHLGGLLESAHA
jgi:ubiquinone/menaquinone biosynthesis C-methylase UbiE